MSRSFYIVAVLVAIVGVAQATPVLTMSEREDILRLRDLLQSKALYDLLHSSDEETTEAPTTTEALTTKEEPEPVQFDAEYGQGQGSSGLTSGQICGMAQSLYPRSERVESKRDLVVNMIYHVCLPSVGREDLEAIGLILSFLRGEEEGVSEPEVPTTPEPEEEKPLPDWQMLLDKLAEAQGSIEETGDEEEVEAEATTPAAAAESGADAGVEAGADAGTDAGADAGAGTGADADAGADAVADADADAGAGAGAEAGADAGAGAGAGADSEGGQETDVSPAKRQRDEEFLRLLLKAVEMNNEKYYN